MSLKVLNNLALVLLHKETSVRAGELLDTALEIYPSYPSALFNRGLVYFIRKEDEQACVLFKKALKHEKQNKAKVLSYLAQSSLTVAFTYQREGYYDKAKGLLQETLDYSNMAIQKGSSLPMVFQVRCSVGHELNLDAKQSLSYCDRALELNEKMRNDGIVEEMISEENAHNAAALILRGAESFKEAAARYELGLSVNPHCFELLVNAGG